jgi:hypothetical protein
MQTVFVVRDPATNTVALRRVGFFIVSLPRVLGADVPKRLCGLEPECVLRFVEKDGNPIQIVVVTAGRPVLPSGTVYESERKVARLLKTYADARTDPGVELCYRSCHILLFLQERLGFQILPAQTAVARPLMKPWDLVCFILNLFK